MVPHEIVHGLGIEGVRTVHARSPAVGVNIPVNLCSRVIRLGEQLCKVTWDPKQLDPIWIELGIAVGCIVNVLAHSLKCRYGIGRRALEDTA